MGRDSNIGWTDHTFNPWLGCTKISAGCDHCYAERWSGRFHLVEWGNAPRRRTSAQNWNGPLRWNDQARAASAPRTYDGKKRASGARALGHRQPDTDRSDRTRVFCASLADVFDNQVPADWRADLWHMIARTGSLDWLMLTKRPENIRRMLPPDWGYDGYPNVWLGTTVEDVRAMRRIELLREIPARVRFLSIEPLIEALPDLPLSGIDWVIVGGESGQDARPIAEEWVRDIRDRCVSAGVAFFFKQWGGIRPSAGGRLLDGRTWDEAPSGGPTRARLAEGGAPPVRGAPLARKSPHVVSGI
ncbi:MAG: phage Gp37/Gp68 family protein [Acidiphilium sp.]|nr:phage Gp37/Gp68 family protein [Acidiphilium sp.]